MTELLKPSITHVDLAPGGLTDLSQPNKLSGTIQTVLSDWYRSPDRGDQVMAGLVNHCATARAVGVMVTKQILEEMVQSDPNVVKKFTVHTRLYKKIALYLFRGQVFDCFRPSQRGRRGIASVWVLKPEVSDLCGMTSEDFTRFKELLTRLKINPTGDLSE